MGKLFRKGFLLVLVIFIAGQALATHYRAGEITYRQISLNTYEIIAITYTDPTNTSADRSELELFFGDGKSAIVPRSNSNGEIVTTDPNNPKNQIKKNIYKTTHTYPGGSQYIISLNDPNRIDGIRNINNGMSVNIPFYVESLLVINSLGFNQSPVLLLPPIDVGCKFRVFKHNPAAYDPDGDSLAFTIIAPKMAVGIEVPNFTIPEFGTPPNDSFSLAVNNGQVTWSTPQVTGAYNFAILIREFRKGILIGYVVRDMQVYINENCNNDPPIFTAVKDTCILAYNLLHDTIRASDPNLLQEITIRYYGGPFVQSNSPATLTPNNASGEAKGIFTVFNWRPSCNAIRYRKHQAVFRVTDNDTKNPLSDIIYWNIKVIGPAPKNLQVKQDSNGFALSWKKDTCNLAYGYKIYRRVDSSYWQHNVCETGVPAYTGFTLYDTTQGVNNTTYFDNEAGRGISPLTRYCYRVTSWYPPRTENGTIIVSDATEGYSSDEVCDIILRTKPIITNVSVEETSVNNGKIFIKWLKPNVLDSDQNKPPYQMILQRSVVPGSNYVNVGNPFDYPTFADLKDEQLTDSNLNTANIQYIYKVVLKSTQNGQLITKEESVAANSVWLNLAGTNRSIILKWVAQVPWKNNLAVIYRKNSLNLFDSIGVTYSNQYTDTGLYNGYPYCYYVETQGNYNLNFYPFLLLNKSQEICGSPKDTIRPCAPLLSIDTPCNSFNNFTITLNWIYPSGCDQDVTKYRILWRKNLKEPWKQIDSVDGKLHVYNDTRESLKFSIAGCYSVLAVDSFNNESYTTNARCIDNCPYYIIPNVFTPNNDGVNDLLIPFPYRFIDRIDISIYDRWGLEVFHTNEININWNGKDKKSNIECTEGVYFYICDVFESYLDGTRKRTLKGTIQLIR
ncbi:MAG: gliding motility-associated C-terminal domain-containing protein [Bacteroidota bacterium]|nr:gliding motility-associated C-terminal domain-containing protein [Bacteroidota bacterium]